MSADLLRRAAETMRREETPFFDALAEWLEVTAKYLPGTEHDADTPYAVAVAESYLLDPGDIPAGAS